jgi:hypothetical protein
VSGEFQMKQSNTLGIAITKLILIALIVAICVIIGLPITRELNDYLHETIFFAISGYIIGLFVTVVVGYPNKFPFNSSGLSNRKIVIAKFATAAWSIGVYIVFALIVTRDIDSLFWQALWLLFGGAIAGFFIIFFLVSYPHSVLFNLNRLLYPEGKREKENKSSLNTDQ